MNIKNIIKNNPILRSIAVGVMIAFCLSGIIIPKTINADFANPTDAAYVAKITKQASGVVKTIKVVVTAYSSSWDETTGIPGVPGTITASGKNVSREAIANNMLPFGTKVRIPSLYGNKIFTIEDRMAKRMGSYHIDLWMPSKEMALNFGVKTAEIEILQD